MEHTPTQNCRNCQYPLPDDAFFCPYCGQRNTDGRITFGELWAHFLANLLNFDGRIFQTMAALFVPGKLTKHFFEGKQIRYYHPVRLFVLSGALFIALLSIMVSNANIDAMDKLWENREKSYEVKKMFGHLDTLGQEIGKEYTLPEVQQALDTLEIRFQRKNPIDNKDSIEITNVINIGSGASENQGRKIALDDLVEMSEKKLADKYAVEGFWNRLIFLQNIRIQKSLKNFFFYIIGNILWMVLFMMPMLALALKLLYHRRPLLYVEHLIFSFHTHIFGFILYSLLFLLNIWTGVELINWAILVIGFYLLLGMKRFYGQAWWKTILKFIATNIFYMLIFFIAGFVMALVSVFLF